MMKRHSPIAPEDARDLTVLAQRQHQRMADDAAAFPGEPLLTGRA